MCPAVPAWPCPCKVSRGSLLAGFTCHFLEATLSGGPEGGLSGWPLGGKHGLLSSLQCRESENAREFQTHMRRLPNELVAGGPGKREAVRGVEK